MELRPPLYALLFAPDEDVHISILEGEKAITIREGARDYQEGRPVMLCCHIKGFCVMADITNVRHCVLAHVTEEEWQADGYTSRWNMYDDLRAYYPDIKWNDTVTIIRWTNVRGTQVDKWRQEVMGPASYATQKEEEEYYLANDD